MQGSSQRGFVSEGAPQPNPDLSPAPWQLPEGPAASLGRSGDGFVLG